MTSTLRTLAHAILSGIDTIEDLYSKAGVPLPSLNSLFSPSSLDKDDALGDAQRLVAGAAAQIIATTRQPMEYIQESTFSGMYTTASLGFVVEVDIPDLLKEAGPQGLEVKDIAAATRVDAAKLGRVLRFLAARHIFTELSPNIFANNRLSSVLIKPKPYQAIKANPESKYENAGLAAFIGHVAGEGLRSSGFFTSFLIDPKGLACPFNMAMDYPSTVWEWYTKPENEHLGVRAAAAIKSGAERHSPKTFETALDWPALKDNDVVVDVGGGVGDLTLLLAKAFPRLKFIMQDQKTVIPEAEKFWEEEAPELIANGRVALQAYDFFTRQPIEGAAVYCLRFVLHDWDTAKCIEILKNTRAAAGPSSTLIIWDHFVPNACPGIDSKTGVSLLPLGMDWATGIDMQMLNLLNGQERTFSEFIEIGEAAGWKYKEKKFGRCLVILMFSPV